MYASEVVTWLFCHFKQTFKNVRSAVTSRSRVRAYLEGSILRFANSGNNYSWPKCREPVNYIYSGRQYEMERRSGDLRARSVLLLPRRGRRWRHAALVVRPLHSPNQSRHQWPRRVTTNTDRVQLLELSRSACHHSCVPLHIIDHCTCMLQNVALLVQAVPASTRELQPCLVNMNPVNTDSPLYERKFRGPIC